VTGRGLRAREDTPTLSDIQSTVQHELREVEVELRRIVDDDSPLIAAVSAHLMGMKGKLLRPTLVLLANTIDDRPGAGATTLAAILELIHVATLVHDDAVDHSVLRRGMPTLNSLLGHQVSVIAGDFLYLRALKELARLGNVAALRIITDASDEMTRGELTQLTRDDALAVSEEDYEHWIEAKTASLFRAACELGSLSGAPEYRASLGRYGLKLGMAFQITDDLLDYTSEQAVTGKPSGLDLRERKMTLPLIAALRSMSPDARARVESLFASETPTDAEIHDVIAIVAETGGLDYARRRGAAYALEAESALAELPNTGARAVLADTITYVTERSR
jgi:octaprenyl-diphosphate synthase